MRIAVLIGEMGFDSQRRIMTGILDRARVHKDQIYLFAGDAEDYVTHYKYESGEFNIYNLPDFSCFDGVIFAPDTIHNYDTVDAVTARIRDAGVPCVSLNYYIEGFMYVKMVNDNAMRDIVEHLVLRHGVRNIFHIAGPEGNNDADERLQTVMEVCSHFSIPFDESCHEHGNYSNRSGYDIMDRFLAEGRELPDAVVAANDLMAFGATTRLREAGYRIPDDVIVTGYDNSGYAEIHRPGLTTVRRGETDCGSMAYDLLESYIQTGIRQDSTVIMGTAVFSGSCGCEDLSHPDLDALSNQYIDSGLSQSNRLHFLKLMMAEATGLRDYDDFQSSVRMFIPLIRPKEAYICIKGDRDEYALELNHIAENIAHGHKISDYMSNTTVAVAWKDGEFLPEKRIPTSELIPEAYINRDQYNFFMFLPLHHQEHCFGYAVLANDEEFMLNDPFTFLFALTISSAMETVFRQDSMRAILTKLDKLSTTDELTGVMNRAGARTRWPALREKACSQGLKTGVLFADLDNLKKVNDHYGHEEGDRYIVTIAEAMKRLPLKDGFVFRYGGDEFVAVCMVRQAADMNGFVDRIHLAIEAYNRAVPAHYQRHVSIGVTVSDQADLEDIIREADERMYVDKMKNKAEAGKHR